MEALCEFSECVIRERTRALAVLEKLRGFQTKQKREVRIKELLKVPMPSDRRCWFMCVPASFNDALDIKITARVIRKQLDDGSWLKTTEEVWTQGATFSFSQGDIFYSNHPAYTSWLEALKAYGISIQVVRTFGMAVTVAIFKATADRTRVFKVGEYPLHSSDLVRLFIEGPDERLRKEIDRTTAA